MFPDCPACWSSKISYDMHNSPMFRWCAWFDAVYDHADCHCDQAAMSPLPGGPLHLRWHVSLPTWRPFVFRWKNEVSSDEYWSTTYFKIFTYSHNIFKYDVYKYYVYKDDSHYSILYIHIYTYIYIHIYIYWYDKQSMSTYFPMCVIESFFA